MRRLAGLLTVCVLLAACGASPTPSSSTPSASSGSLSLVLTALTTDTSGIRRATVAVTVRGPLVVNPTYCGHPAPVTLWAVDSQGRRLPDDTAYPQYCEMPTTQAIPAGARQAYSALVSWPAAAGAVTLHGQVALVNGYLTLLTLSVPASERGDHE
jgi:hypothetical protein